MKHHSILPILGLAALTAFAGCACPPKGGTPAPAPDQPAEPAAPLGLCPDAPYVEGGNTVVSMAYPTMREATSVLCVQKIGPTEVMAGDEFAYTLRVTNLTSDPIEGITVTDRLPPGFSMISTNPPAGGGGNVASWRIARLDGRASEEMQMVGVANSTGQLTNCADIAIDNNICLTTAVNQLALQLMKEGPAEVLACDPIPYTFTITNTGSGVAPDIVIEDPLPAGLTTMSGDSNITIMVGSLGAGESQSFTESVKATGTGTYTNSATAIERGTGVSTSSNTVTTRVRKPALDINVTCTPRVFVGGEIQYQIAVTNMGDAGCRDTVVEASIPAGTSFESASDGGAMSGANVTWVMPELGPGASATMSMSVRANMITETSMTATARCVCADPVSAGCPTKIEGIPAVLLEVIDVEDPDMVGTTETYIIRVTNQGSAPDTSITIDCELEPQMEFVSTSGPTNGTSSGMAVNFEPLPVLNAGQVVEWQVVVRSVAPGDVRFKAVMNTDQLTRPVEETEATNFYQP